METNNQTSCNYSHYEDMDSDLYIITDVRVINDKEVKEKHKFGYFGLDAQRQDALNKYVKYYKTSSDESQKNDAYKKAQSIFYMCLKRLALSPRTFELYFKYFNSPIDSLIFENICDALSEYFDYYLEKYKPDYKKEKDDGNSEYPFYPYFRICVFGNSKNNKPGALNNFFKKLKNDRDNTIQIDSNNPNDENEPILFEIVDSANDIEKNYIEQKDNGVFINLANSFSFMLNYQKFLKHYNNDLRQASSERYNYYKMFYTCDTVKYLKELPQLQNLLLSRSDKIINGCDDNFFKYILNCNQHNKFACLSETIKSEFKKFKELAVNIFADEDLELQISIDEQLTGKEIGLLKLKNEGLIYASYKLHEKGYSNPIPNNIKNKEKALVSQKKSDYKKYHDAFLHTSLGKNGDEKYG